MDFCISNVLSRLTIYYKGKKISDEPIVRDFFSYLSTDNSKYNNRFLYKDTDSILFKVAVITFAFCNSIMLNEATEESILEELYEGDTVLFNNKRYMYLGVEDECSTSSFKKGKVKLSNDKDETEWYSLSGISELLRYEGEAESLDGKGIRNVIGKRNASLKKLFGVGKSTNLYTLDNCCVVVMEKHEAEDVFRNIDYKIDDGGKISLLELITVTYYSEMEEYHFPNNPAKNVPVVKVVNSIYKAREHILNYRLKEVSHLVTFGKEKLIKDYSVLEEIWSNEFPGYVICSSHMNFRYLEEVAALSARALDYSLTKDYIESKRLKIRANNKYTTMLRDSISLINNRSLKLKNVGDSISVRDDKDFRYNIIKIKRSSGDNTCEQEFVMSAYSLMKLYRTAPFTLKEMETVIKRHDLAIMPPYERLKNTIEFANESVSEFKDEVKIITDILGKVSGNLSISNELSSEFRSHIRYNLTYSRTAVVVSKMYYSTVLHGLSIDEKFKGMLYFYTPDNFDYRKTFDEVIALGVFEGAKFNVFNCFNAKKVSVYYYDYQTSFLDGIRLRTQPETNAEKSIETSDDRDITDDGIEKELNDFMLEMMTHISLPAVAQNGYDANGLLEVKAVGAFADGESIYFSKDYKPYLYDDNSSTVKQVEVNKLKPGDILLFTKNGTLTHDIVDEVLKGYIESGRAEDSLVKSMQKVTIWKKLLVDYIDEHDISYNEMAKRLTDAGLKRQGHTLRTWINPAYHINGPTKIDDYRVLGSVLGNADLAEHYKDYWQATSEIRTLRREILKRISKAIVKDICGDLAGDEMSKYVEEYSDELAVLMELVAIKKVSGTRLPYNYVNRPFSR